MLSLKMCLLFNAFELFHTPKKKRKEKVYKIVTEAHSFKTKLKIIIVFHRRRIRQTLAADDFTRCKEVQIRSDQSLSRVRLFATP